MSTIIFENQTPPEQTAFTKQNPYISHLKKRTCLNTEGSTKKTFFVSLDIKNADIVYQEGDIVCVLPKNPDKYLDEVFSLLKEDKDKEITHPKTQEAITLYDFFAYHIDFEKITGKFVQAMLPFIIDCEKKAYLEGLFQPENKDKKKKFLKDLDYLLFLKNYPHNVSLESQLPYFLPLMPRLYSITSSQSFTKNQIDLLITTFSYKKGDVLRHGIGSNFLCYEADENTPIPIYLQKTKHFLLPEDSHIPIIMIGPGTGVAPFRAFIQKRSLATHPTQNWLFFGERNKEHDFYYKDELEEYVEQGVLKLSTAFSRDQEEKHYVQHEIWKNRNEVWQWVLNDAVIYVCGDARYMAKDVENTFLSIFETEGMLSSSEAKEFLKDLRKEKRYVIDVY